MNTTSAVIVAGESEAAEATRARDTWTLADKNGAWLVNAYQSSPMNVG